MIYLRAFLELTAEERCRAKKKTNKKIREKSRSSSKTSSEKIVIDANVSSFFFFSCDTPLMSEKLSKFCTTLSHKCALCNINVVRRSRVTVLDKAFLSVSSTYNSVRTVQSKFNFLAICTPLKREG